MRIIKFVTNRFAVFRYVNYRLFFIGLSFSRVGDAMQFIASSWLVMHVSQHASSVFILAACRSLPLLLLGPVMGVLVDISRRKKFAIRADIFLGCVTCSIPVLWWLNRLEAWEIYLATFLMTAG